MKSLLQVCSFAFVLAISHSGYSSVDASGKFCSSVFVPTVYSDLDQFDVFVGRKLGFDGLTGPLIQELGLCGPFCVVNEVGSKDTRFKSEESRVALLSQLIREAPDQLKIPSDRMLKSLLVWEVGGLFKLITQKIGRSARVEYRGEVRPNLPDAAFDVQVPEEIEIGKPSELTVADLYSSTRDKTSIVALVKVNSDLSLSEVSRQSGWGHFVIIERISFKTGVPKALIRDPEFSQRPYWVELSRVKGPKLRFSSFRMANPSLIEERQVDFDYRGPSLFLDPTAIVLLPAVVRVHWN